MHRRDTPIRLHCEQVTTAQATEGGGAELGGTVLAWKGYDAVDLSLLLCEKRVSNPRLAMQSQELERVKCLARTK